MADEQIRIREAGAGDLSDIISVCSASLGWTNPHWDRQLFAWKHNRSPFGESIVLIAEDSTGIRAVRPLMMWRFASLEGTVRAARPVDTATRPDAQGRGLFTQVTEVGITRLRRSGVAFIFNTPNEKSLPGYLKMGWHEAGRVPFGIRVRSPLTAPQVLRSKVAASKQSEPTPELGIEPNDFLHNLPSIPKRVGRRWRTDYDLASLIWRYADGPVSYRALPIGPDAGVIVRVRKRGHSRELLVAEVIGDVHEDHLRATLLDALRSVRATHMIGPAGTPGMITTRRVGPPLTMREVAVFNPDSEDMAWAPGDLELF